MDDIKQRIIDAGFPRAAGLIDGTHRGLRLCLRELRRFQPASFGEAMALQRATAAIPEFDDGSDE